MSGFPCLATTDAEGLFWAVIVIGVIFVVVMLAHQGGGGGRHIICPNAKCNYEGRARKQARGSLLVGLILLCFFVLPGIIYFMLKSGYRYSCPQCGLQVAADN